MLDRLNSLVYRLNTDNSNKYKEEQLRMHSGDEELKRILFYTYNPFYQFNVTSKNCIKNKNLSTPREGDLFNLLDDLRLRI